MAATSPIHTTRRGMPALGALFLAVAGNILVVVIAGVAVVSVAAAAMVVFGAGILESF